MKFAKRLLMVAGAVALAGLFGVMLAPKAVHAVVSTLVTVSNTTSQPVPTMAVDTRNVNVVNTPNVNVNSLPAVQLGGTPSVNVASMPPVNASLNGNVPVTNPIDQNQNPIPLDVESNDYSPIEVGCSGRGGSGNFVGCSPSITVPAGSVLVVDDVSIDADLDPGLTEEGTHATISVTVHNGITLAVDFAIPLQAQGTAPGGGLEFVGAQRTHLYAFPPSSSLSPVSCEVDTPLTTSSNALIDCVIAGHLVKAE